VCYSWQIALDIYFDVILDNMKDRKEFREKAGEVNIMKACVTKDETSSLILNRFYTTLSKVILVN
jgi:hypothetical protein